jgi:hypothetical protein
MIATGKRKVSSYVLTCSIALAALAGGIAGQEALAWGPHPTITKAALDTLPELDRWKQVLGPENVAAFTNYCWLPDQRGQDLGAFYADDYLLIRAVPRYVGHCMPDVAETYEPYFRRALQALRTETPANACRQIGPLLHFIEDSGAPCHAKPRCPHHMELENWVKADLIAIPGYRPQLLGKTDDEALAGLKARMAGLVVFSSERAERALTLFSSGTPDRSQVEPIILESALESARVAADLFHTLFTLGLAEQPAGAGLTGTITAAQFPGGNNHGARIVLVDTNYATLAMTSPSAADKPGWQGTYAFHHLPAGTYRVLAYRTASQMVLSEPITLKTGETTTLDLTLAAAQPAGNIVENPDGRLAYLLPDMPDRWQVKPAGDRKVWTSAQARVKPGKTYRCGAVLKDPAAKVRFILPVDPHKKDRKAPATIVPLKSDGLTPPEVSITPDADRGSVLIQVETQRPLAEAIERVWVVPASSAGK